VGETLARVFGGPLVDLIGRAHAVRLTTALGTVGLALFILSPSASLVLAGTLLWAVGVSMGFPLGMSAAAESGPNPAARVSVVASVGYLANLAGPPLIGLLSQSLGVLTALWAVAALLAVGFAASGALRPRPSAPRS
jgi:MFS family permease